MLTQQQLIAYFEDQLPPGERAEFEQLLANEPEAQWSLADQENIDLALRVLLGKAESRERVKQSIFTVLRGASAEQLTAHVMEETRNGQAAGTLPLARRFMRSVALWSRSERAAEGALVRAQTWSQWWIAFQGHFRGQFALSAAIAVVVLGCWLFLYFLPRPPAPVVIGQFTTVVGAPTVRHARERSNIDAQRSTLIHLGDHIETRDADRAEIEFKDGTTLRLHFNTAVQITIPSSGSGTTNPPLARPPEISLLRGQVWTKVHKATNETRYAVRTALATALARGTEFGVKLHRAKTSSTNSARPSTFNAQPPAVEAVLTVKEGTVDFFNSFGSVQATAMRESTARAGFPPTEPKRLQTLQSLPIAPGSTWDLITSPLTWPQAGEKLAGAGGGAGLHLRNLPKTNSTPDPITPSGTNEVQVTMVHPDSPALRAGLEPGDVLVALDGRAVTNATHFLKEILLRANTTTTLTVRRQGEEKRLSLEVTSRTNNFGPKLGRNSAAQLSALMRKWCVTPAFQSANSTLENQRNQDALQISRSNPLRAAACNNLGVLFELEDALGPAIRAYGRAAYIDPQVPLYHYNLAQALRKIGSFERALEEFETAARLAPESTLVQKWLAEIHSLLGDQTEAMRLTDALIQTAPQDHGPWELKAQLLTKQNRGAEALEAARKAVELDPACSVALGYLAGALQRQGDLAGAEETYRKALELAPFDALLHMNLGTVQHDRSQLSSAEQSFRKAIELRPEFVLAYRNLASVLADRRDWTRAEAALTQARELEPENVQGIRDLGNLALKQARFDEAETQFRKALESSPEDAESYFGLGEVRRGRGRHTEAEQMYRKAIELNPSYAQAYAALAEVYRDAFGQLDKAEELYRQFMQFAPQRAEPYSGLGRLMVMRGNLREAEQLLRKARDLDPNSSQVHNNLGEVLRLRGNLDEALASYRKALELDTSSVSPYNNLGIIHAMRGEFAEAEKMFRALLERAAGNASINPFNFLINLAMVCGKQGKLEDEEKFYRQALALRPNDPAICNSLAWFLADHKLNLDEALTLGRRAVQAAPEDPNFLDTLGWVLFQRGELDEAEKTLKKALEVAGENPPSGEIREHLKKVQEKKGTRAE